MSTAVLHRAPSVCLSVRPSVCQSPSAFVYLSVCLSVTTPKRLIVLNYLRFVPHDSDVSSFLRPNFTDVVCLATSAGARELEAPKIQL